LEDEIAAFLHLLESGLSGPVNVTAPHPVTNAEFMKTLGRVLRRPTVMPMPRLALNVLLGSERAKETLLDSQRVLPRRLQADGFRFKFPELEPAMGSALAGR
ncbi:MAG: DUF1731 domain-containing protein, partial [Acidimicrobiia bacterium]